jgi:hypothetical protein
MARQAACDGKHGCNTLFSTWIGGYSLRYGNFAHRTRFT